MKIKILAILSLGLNFSYGQTKNVPDELFGFRLGQYKSVVTNELGQPSQTKVMNDSTVIDFYYITQDSSSYVGFQYLPTKPNEINAIQISGTISDRPFYGTNLGDNEKKIISAFGKPDTLLTQDFNNKEVKIWKYIKLNLSILFRDKQVESIRIWDDYEKKDYNPPTIEQLLEIIKTKDKGKIADILSPGLEIYYCDKIITWKNSFYKDIYSEKASVMDFITNDEYGLTTLNKTNLEHDFNLRVVTGTGTFPVYKFPKEPLIKELVLNYEQGRYKIWEIKYKCEN